MLEVVLAAHPIGCLANLLHRRQHHANEDADDRNHHQQLDQGEAGAGRGR
jgi:hypothetical protein